MEPMVLAAVGGAAGVLGRIVWSHRQAKKKARLSAWVPIHTWAFSAMGASGGPYPAEPSQALRHAYASHLSKTRRALFNQLMSDYVAQVRTAHGLNPSISELTAPKHTATRVVAEFHET